MTLVFLGAGDCSAAAPCDCGRGTGCVDGVQRLLELPLLILNAEAKKDSGLPPDNPTPPNAAQPK